MHTCTKEKDSTIKDSLLTDSEPPAISELSSQVPNIPSSNIRLSAATELPVHSSETKSSDSKVLSGSIRSESSLEIMRQLTSSESSDRNEAHWLKLKRAAISKDIPLEASLTCLGNRDVLENGEKREESKPKLVKKPSLVLTRKTKHYRYVLINNIRY